jgi:DNA-binding NarL/FixJ family response regulator
MAKENSTTPARTVRVLIVDDHPIVREGFVQLISQQPDLDVCGHAETVTDALRITGQTRPHLAIVDIMLADGNGIELIKRLKAEHPQVKVLAVSAHDETMYAERSLRAGALGFVNKREVAANLIAAIRRVLSGDIYLSERMSGRVLRRASASTQSLEQDPVESLTNRELEAFELVGRGLTTHNIAKHMGVSPKTVERYKENIKRKLNLAHSVELLQHATRWAMENG